MLNENVITNPRLLNFENMCFEKNVDYSSYINLVEFLQAYDDHVIVNYLDYEYTLTSSGVYEPSINTMIRMVMNNPDTKFITEIIGKYVMFISSYDKLDNMDTVDDVIHNGQTLHIYSKYITSNENTTILSSINVIRTYSDKLMKDDEMFSYIRNKYNTPYRDGEFTLYNEDLPDNVIIKSDYYEYYEYYDCKSSLLEEWSHNKLLVDNLSTFQEDSEYEITELCEYICTKHELAIEPRGDFAEYITGSIKFVCGFNTIICDIDNEAAFSLLSVENM